MHPDNVPERLKDQYKAVYENAKNVPIVDRHVMDIFNSKCKSHTRAILHFYSAKFFVDVGAQVPLMQILTIQTTFRHLHKI